MAHLMKNGKKRMRRSIDLVHLVGEELPADCLGARTFIKQAKARATKIAGVIVLDMIGVDRQGKRKVQLSVGRHPESTAIAGEVQKVITDLHLNLRPVVRPYGTRKSFLHQTDAIHFSR